MLKPDISPLFSRNSEKLPTDSHQETSFQNSQKNILDIVCKSLYNRSISIGKRIAHYAKECKEKANGGLL